MADIDWIVCFWTIFVFCLINVYGKDTVIEYHEDRKPCKYFKDTRYVESEPGLVNCTWYAASACCKRTEVTSVFTSNMLPLNRASTECKNRINFLMCFFCSPDQYLWYREGRAHVCESFCLSIHEACQDAFSEGTRLGDIYHNGTAFCEAQDFKVVNSKYCFKYDPTVFGTGSQVVTIPILLLVPTLLARALLHISV